MKNSSDIFFLILHFNIPVNKNGYLNMTNKQIGTGS